MLPGGGDLGPAAPAMGAAEREVAGVRAWIEGRARLAFSRSYWVTTAALLWAFTRLPSPNRMFVATFV